MPRNRSLKRVVDGKPRSLGECAMLMITEIAEATEEVRNKRPAVYAISLDGSTQIESLEEIAAKGLKPEGEAVELADCLIRLGDYFGYIDADAEEWVTRNHRRLNSGSMEEFHKASPLEQHVKICESLALAGGQRNVDGILLLAQAWAYIEQTAASRGWDLEEVIELKANYNKTRSYRHGGKAL